MRGQVTVAQLEGKNHPHTRKNQRCLTENNYCGLTFCGVRARDLPECVARTFFLSLNGVAMGVRRMTRIAPKRARLRPGCCQKTSSPSPANYNGQGEKENAMLLVQSRNAKRLYTRLPVLILMSGLIPLPSLLS